MTRWVEYKGLANLLQRQCYQLGGRTWTVNEGDVAQEFHVRILKAGDVTGGGILFGAAIGFVTPRPAEESCLLSLTVAESCYCANSWTEHTV